MEDGYYMATIVGLPDVIATVESIEDCQEDLIEVIEEWIAFSCKEALPFRNFEFLADTLIIP